MYLPRIDEEKCVSCGECVDVCPADVLKADDTSTTVADPAQCLGCESCISVCPNEAITVDEI
jgi:NAD-dependent dihydropyrimidine dehydrogenase PreA subunit